MADLTECPPDTIPAHLARLDAISELIRFACNHEMVPGACTRLSGAQLIMPATLADYLACLEITRKTHRAPPFVNERDETLARMERKLDVLAGCFAQSPALNAVLEEAEVDSGW